MCIHQPAGRLHNSAHVSMPPHRIKQHGWQLVYVCCSHCLVMLLCQPHARACHCGARVFVCGWPIVGWVLSLVLQPYLGIIIRQTHAQQLTCPLLICTACHACQRTLGCSMLHACQLQRHCVGAEARDSTSCVRPWHASCTQ